jgi:hypothetical protein
MFDRIIGELIEDTPAIGEIDRHLGERLKPAVKPVGLKRDRRDQAGAPRGLSALPRSVAQPGESGPGSSRGDGSIRDVCLMGLDRGPHNTSLFQHWLVIELAPSRRDLFSAA